MTEVRFARVIQRKEVLTLAFGAMIGASRTMYALSHARQLPAWPGELHPRFKTPYKAVLFIGGLSVLAPLFGRQALTLPYEWAIVAGWWVTGLGLLGFRIWSDR